MLSQPMNFLTFSLPILFPHPAAGGGWARSCVVLICQPGLHHVSTEEPSLMVRRAFSCQTQAAGGWSWVDELDWVQWRAVSEATWACRGLPAMPASLPPLPCTEVLKCIASYYLFDWELELQVNWLLWKKNMLDPGKWGFSERRGLSG